MTKYACRFSAGILFFLLFLPSVVVSRETAHQWELVNPQGIVRVDPVKITPHPSTLEGKTVILRWNGKPNGDHFLNRLAELLNERVRGVKVIKAWEVAPETKVISYSPDTSRAIAKKLLAYKPDIVIAAPAD